MTVEELIQKLQGVPSDYIIYTSCGDEECEECSCPITFEIKEGGLGNIIFIEHDV